ncbi:MAG: hypothetical protein N2595_01675 [bacterium]|nr:hypothetical protein [bacterium]
MKTQNLINEILNSLSEYQRIEGEILSEIGPHTRGEEVRSALEVLLLANKIISLKVTAVNNLRVLSGEAGTADAEELMKRTRELLQSAFGKLDGLK